MAVYYLHIISKKYTLYSASLADLGERSVRMLSHYVVSAIR